MTEQIGQFIKDFLLFVNNYSPLVLSFRRYHIFMILTRSSTMFLSQKVYLFEKARNLLRSNHSY
jgi:hypothetical protein